MPTERQEQETVARCVSIAVYYHGAARSGDSRTGMAQEVREAVDWMNELGVDGRRILGRLQEELVARYGPEEGGRMRAMFAQAIGRPHPRAPRRVEVPGSVQPGGRPPTVRT